MKRAAAMLLTIGLSWSPLPARAADRHLAVVIDTSGSMTDNDKPRYTVQATKILSDLLDDRDRMIAIGMPRSESCDDGPNRALAVEFQASDRAGFKAAIDSKIHFEDGTHFAAPVRTAIDFLAAAPKGKRLLLILADAGGFEPCDAPLTQALLGYRATGGDAGVVNLGAMDGPFFHNPAFSSAHGAQSSRKLLDAIAAVYQSFLGSRKPQTGDVSGRVEVTIDELVSEAFLIVAADGPVGALTSSPQNPYAAAMELDLNGGGRTEGLDGVTRSYRIVRLSNPDAGAWVFEAEGLSASAGYLLIQDYAVQIRMVSPKEVPMGRESRVSFEVVDPRTGKRVASTTFLGDVKITAEIGGKKVELVRGADGTFSAPVRFDREGRQAILATLKSDRVSKVGTAEVEVIRPSWAMVPNVPPKADLETQVKLVVRVEPSDPAAPAPRAYPDRVKVQGTDGTMELVDDGTHGDEHAGDHLYTVLWTPRTMGAHPLQFEAQGGERATPTSATVDVTGKLRFGETPPIEIGPVRSKSSGTSALSFAGAEVKGEYDLRLTSTFKSRGTALEIDPGGGFEPLGTRPVALRLAGGGPREFAVRARVGPCPTGCKKEDAAQVTVTTTGPDGAKVEISVPVRIEVVPDPWLSCYWPFLVLGAALILGGIFFHGYWSPSRFSPRLGIKLSPEEDIEEGVFYTIRAQPGTRSGFYRDARVFVSSDYRVSGRSRGAIARLRAQGDQVMIQRVTGSTLFRQSADGEWEDLGPEESRARLGSLYRDEGCRIYFQLRTG